MTAIGDLPTRAKPSARLHALNGIRSIGLVAVVVTLAAGVAAVIQHLSRLPSSYSWDFCFDLLWNNVRETWFPVFAFVAAATGFVCRGNWLEPLRTASVRRRRFAVGIALLSGIGVSLWQPTYGMLDVICVMLLAGYLAVRPASNSVHALRSLAETAFSVGAYVLASYAHTVGKALMLLHPTRDEIVVGIEHALFGVPIHETLTRWTADMPTLLAATSRLYRTQTHQILLYAIFLTCAGQLRTRREFLSIIAIGLLVGAPLYHVLPCLGPYYVQPELYTHLAPLQLASDWYQWLQHNTAATIGGYAEQVQTFQYVAAMPSLHVGFTAGMVYATWRWPLLRAFSIVLALATWSATMVLGWHYFLDGFFGLLVCGVTIAWVRLRSDLLLPAPLRNETKLMPTGKHPALRELS